MRKLIIGTIASLALASTPAIAQQTVGGGVSASGPQGSVAGGATAGSVQSKKKHKRHHQREERRMERPSGNSASTYGSGTVYTDRNRATGGVTTGGSAAGTGRQSTTSTVDAYASTGAKGGSEAEVYGDSTARSGSGN